MKRQFKTKNNTIITRETRWIKIRNEYVTPRHSLWNYADTYGTDNPNEGLLTYFIHNGKKYALGQFMRLSYPIFFEDETEKTNFLSGYDSTEWYNPYLIEIEDGGEYCRLYTEQREVA